MTIPYSQQWIDDDDIQAVVDVLKSDFLTTGPEVAKFERALCDYTGAEHCVVVSSGTAALNLATSVLTGCRKQKYIAVPAISFIASASCIVHSGNTPLFVDIDYNTHNISTKELDDLLYYSKTQTVREVVGILSVDMCGLPCDWQELRRIADDNNCFLIRDAAHSLGATYKGEKTGSCKYADVTTLSFHPVKLVTSNEGGAILTNNKELADKCRALRNHGLPDIEMLGYNYRMSDVHAALGISQLKKINRFVQSRKFIAHIYDDLFHDFEHMEIPDIPKETDGHAWHLYTIKVYESIRTKLRHKLLEDHGIGTQIHYRPIPDWEYFQHNWGVHERHYDNATKYAKRVLSIPCYPKMVFSKHSPILIANKIKQTIRELV